MRLSLVLASALVLLPATALAQGGPATRYLHAQNDRVTALLRQHPATDAARTQRETEVTHLLVDILDFDELCRRSLDAHWDGLTPAQRTEFSSILRQLVERNYRSSQERILDYEITYTREETTANGAVVHASARSRASRREPPIEIAYAMHLVGTDWRVVDVTTDGVSLVHTYQQQFHRIITRDGFDALLTRMRDRLAHETGTSGGTTATATTAPH